MPVTAYPFTPEQQALLDGALQDGYCRWAGLQLVDVSQHAASFAFRPHEAMLTPWTTLNGGLINAMVEFPSFIALLTALDPGELAVTNDVFIQHLRRMPGDVDYRMEGRLIQRGRTMAWTEVDVFAADRLVSMARITKSIVSQR